MTHDIILLGKECDTFGTRIHSEGTVTELEATIEKSFEKLCITFVYLILINADGLYRWNYLSLVLFSDYSREFNWEQKYYFKWQENANEVWVNE